MAKFPIKLGHPSEFLGRRQPVSGQLTPLTGDPEPVVGNSYLDALRNRGTFEEELAAMRLDARLDRRRHFILTNFVDASSMMLQGISSFTKLR